MNKILKFNVRRTLIMAILVSVIIGLIIAGIAIAGTIITTDSLNKGLVGHWPLKSDSEKVGSEMWDSAASTFESGTYSWQTWGITTIDNVGNALEITYGDGTLGAYNYLTDNKDLNTNLTVGKRYRLVFDAKSVGGSATAYGDIEVPPDPHVTTSTLTNTMKTYALDFTATSTASNYFSFRGLTVGNVITVDNISLKPLRTADSTPNTNHGTIYGASYTTDRHGQANGAMSFNGTSEYIDLGNDTSLDIESQITVAAWVYWSGSGEDVIYANGSSEATGSLLQTRGTENIRAIHNYNDAYYLIDSGVDTFVSNQWNHVVMTWDGSTLRAYVNTTSVGSDSSGTAVGRSITNSYIGKASWAASRYWDGQISDVRIYNRVLSTDEITRLHESYKPKMSVGSLNQKLVGHWPLRPDSEKVGSEMMTGDDSDFESTVGNWIAYGGQTVERTTIGPITGTGSMRVVGDGINTVAGTYNGATGLTGLTVGKKYALIFKYKGSGSGGINARFGAATVYTGWDYGYVTIDQTDSFVRTGRLEFITTQSTLFLSLGYLSTGTHNEFRIDDIHIKPLHTADTTPNSNHGEIYGANIRNHGASFNGSSDYVDMGDVNAVEGLSAMTISAWIKATDVTNMAKPATKENVWYLFISGGNIYYTIHGSPVNDLLTAVSTNTWYHVVATYTNGGTSYLYINGAQKDTSTGLVAMPTTSYQLSIGAKTNDGGSWQEFFNGQIADVLIYDRALSASEILDLYNGKEVSGAVFDMPLSDKTGFKDISGNANHGTNNGAAIIGESADFDGTDDYINVADYPQVGSDDFSISLWFKTSVSNLAQGLIRKWTTGQREWFLSLAANKGIYFSLSSDGSAQTWYGYENTTRGDDTWHNVVITKSGTSVSYYLDSSSISFDVTGGSVPASVYNGTENTKIGIGPDSPYYFNGQISDVRIYNRALSGSETASLYAKGRSGTSVGMTTGSLNKGLIGQWDLKFTSEKVGSSLISNDDFSIDTNEDGLADDWYITSGVTSGSITDNIQRIQSISIAQSAYKYRLYTTILEIGKNYSVTVKIRSNGVWVGDNKIRVRQGTGGTRQTIISLTNLNNEWQIFTSTFTANDNGEGAGDYNLSIEPAVSSTSTVDDWYEVDFVYVKELRTADSSANSNHGTIYGASYTTDRHGQANKAMSFDGTDDYIDLANAISFGTGDFTIAGWVNASASETGYGVMIADYSSGNLDFYATNSTITNSPKVELTACPTNYLYGGMDIRGAWHHIVLTRSGGTIKLWVDTVVKDTDTCAGDTYMNNPRIGEATHTTTEGFYGSISNIKIYNRALSKQEIIQLYESYN